MYRIWIKIVKNQVNLKPFDLDYREKLVSSDDLLEWLRPFCGDDTLPVKPRIKVLQIMEQAFHLSDEDSKLLVFFRTQAVLKACWPETKVSFLFTLRDSIILLFL